MRCFRSNFDGELARRVDVHHQQQGMHESHLANRLKMSSNLEFGKGLLLGAMLQISLEQRKLDLALHEMSRNQLQMHPELRENNGLGAWQLSDGAL